ncbi:MAG: selenium cofactor biosynthesis protein YqeC [Acidiferrobacterales bacterium]
MADTNLLDLLQARSGLVCTIGAGGKKTTLYRLLALHPGRVALTSTVFIPPFPKQLQVAVVRERSEKLLPALREAAATHRCVAYTQLSSKRGRFEGVSARHVREIHNQLGFDVSFIKADGARTRLIKAPAENEPQLPEEATTVLPIVSARAINAPLSERIAHRVEQIERVTGARAGEPLTPTHIARLLTSEEGLLKGVGDANVVPVINMVEDIEHEALARDAAQRALQLTTRFDYIVLACMQATDPIVGVVRRTDPSADPNIP